MAPITHPLDPSRRTEHTNSVGGHATRQVAQGGEMPWHVSTTSATASHGFRFPHLPIHRAHRRGHTDRVPGTNALTDGAVLQGETRYA